MTSPEENMNTSAILAAIVAVALLPARADAQNMKLQIQDGRVTLDAQNVPVRQILAEWARVGGAKIVNGEKVAGAPLTLQLQAMPEREALDIILRGVSGYMLAARQEGSGVSAFDRIMILPTSSAPRNAGVAPRAGTAGFGRPMRAPAMPVQAEPVEEEVVVADVEEDGDNDIPEPEEDEGGGEAEPQNTPQSPQMNRFQRRNVFPNPMGAQMQPFMPQGGVPVFPGQQQEEPEGAEDEQVTTPGNPFGIPAGASTTPGVVTPVPQQQQQDTPGSNRRPRRPPS
jgi:hypothetical protein